MRNDRAMKKIIRWYLVSGAMVAGTTAIFMPIFYVYLSNINYSNSDIGWYYAVFWISSTIMEVPFGYFTDRFGTKLTLLGSSVMKGIGFSFLAWEPADIRLLIVVALLTGIGESGFSGCLSAWVVNEYNRQETNSADIQIKNIFAKGNMINAIAALAVGMISGQILYKMNFTYPIYASAISFFVLTILFCMFPERKKERISEKAVDRVERRSRKNWNIQWIKENKKLIGIFIILSFPEMINCAPGNQWSKVFEKLEWFGYIWVAFNMVTILSNLFITKYNALDFGRKTMDKLFLLETLLLAGIYVLRNNLYLCLILFLGYVFLYELHTTLNFSYFQEEVISDDAKRTTITSSYNMVSSLIITILLAGVGYMSDYIGILLTWLIIAVIVTALYGMCRKSYKP